MFEDYNKNLLNKPISDEIADQMNVIENMIISSDAFKMQENKPQVNQSKWQSYKIKKIPTRVSIFLDWYLITIIKQLNNFNCFFCSIFWLAPICNLCIQRF